MIPNIQTRKYFIFDQNTRDDSQKEFYVHGFHLREINKIFCTNSQLTIDEERLNTIDIVREVLGLTASVRIKQ